MRYWILSWMAVFALLIPPIGACGGSTKDGTGGDVGAGGIAGSGGTGGIGGGEAVQAGLWTGSGPGGADGAYTICFQVRADGSVLERPANSTPECGVSSIDVEFPDCEGRFATTDRIPIVNGAFRVQFDNAGVVSEVSGTFDGDTAFGEATVQAAGDATCSGSWMATPSD